MKIYIATPMYGGMCHGVYAYNLLSLSKELELRGHEVKFDFIMNESLITRARNTLVSNFLKTDYDYLLFIDGDHGFVAKDVVTMVESGKDLIGAVAPMKGINWNDVRSAVKSNKEDLEHYTGFFNVNFGDIQSINFLEPLEVKTVGTGMLLISRKVFDTMAPHCDKYFDVRDGVIIDTSLDKVTEFFYTVVDPKDGILYSEDFAFCKKWKELGGKVYIAPWIHLTHIGQYVFSGSLYKTVMMSMEKDS